MRRRFHVNTVSGPVLPDKTPVFRGCVPMESDAGSQIRHWHTYLHDMIGNFKSGCSGF